MVTKRTWDGFEYDDGLHLTKEQVDDIFERTRTVVAFTSLNMPRDCPPAAPAPEAGAAAAPQPEEPEEPHRPCAPRTEP